MITAGIIIAILAAIATLAIITRDILDEHRHNQTLKRRLQHRTCRARR